MAHGFLQDEQGNYSNSRLLSLGAFVSIVGFGIADTYGWHASEPVWIGLYSALGGGVTGAVIPRTAQYFMKQPTSDTSGG